MSFQALKSFLSLDIILAAVLVIPQIVLILELRFGTLEIFGQLLFGASRVRSGLPHFTC